MYDPQKRHLEVLELPSFDYEGYFPTLVELINKFLPQITGELVVVLDNGPIHRPKVLREEIRKIFGKRVRVFFLPTYSPNTNPIERVWQQLLNAVVRSCSLPEELRSVLQLALETQEKDAQTQNHAPLKLKCPLCGHQFLFGELSIADVLEKIEKHICFNIPGLNPYVHQVLTHSLEAVPMGQ